MATMSKKRFVRAAGYVFTWELDLGSAEVDLEMHREDDAHRRKFFVAKTRCAPDRDAVYAPRHGDGGVAALAERPRRAATRRRRR
jgi:hypothetical protein